MGSWFENEQLWDSLHDLMFPPESFEQAKGQIERMTKICGLESGDVLDIPCGPGRHSLPLARRGFRVTGVDLTQPLLDRARASARDEGLAVEWVQEDMRTFRREQAYDIALNSFTSLGYFDEWEENVDVVRNILASLRPGGWFFLETLGKEGLASVFREVFAEDLPDGRIFLQRHQIVDSWRRIVNEWSFIDGDRITERWSFEHWLYAAGELIDMFRAVGFTDVETYGGWTDQPYGPRTRRLLVVGRRPIE